MQYVDFIALLYYLYIHIVCVCVCTDTFLKTIHMLGSQKVKMKILHIGIHRTKCNTNACVCSKTTGTKSKMLMFKKSRNTLK